MFALSKECDYYSILLADLYATYSPNRNGLCDPSTFSFETNANPVSQYLMYSVRILAVRGVYVRNFSSVFFVFQLE